MNLGFVDEMLSQCEGIEGIRVRGLMTMAPLGAEESEIRKIASDIYDIAYEIEPEEEILISVVIKKEESV